jgi:hypothetical protein
MGGAFSIKKNLKRHNQSFSLRECFLFIDEKMTKNLKILATNGLYNYVKENQSDLSIYI